MIICMILASVVFLLFTYLFMSADNQVVGALIICCQETQTEVIKQNQIALNLLMEDIRKSKDLNNKSKIRKGRSYKKKINAAQKQMEKLKKGKIGVLDLIPIAGYRMMQLMRWDATQDVIKKLNRKCIQFKEKKEAMNYTYYLLGALFGNVTLGITAFFAGLGLSLGIGLGTRSLIVAVAALAIFALMGYLPYDNVNVVVRKREEEIEGQFPQAVSKMALLAVAGMEVNRAWELTSRSGTGVLYEEMNRVLIDFENNVAPAEAYSKFIIRCNNRYATKLATAILQNMSKGNAEIVKLLRALNDESWLEHKHNARRMGEKIQAKLLLPTMLMFGGIIILVIVPVMSGFNF